MTITGMAAGLPGGEVIIGPVTATGAVVVTGYQSYTLATGDNTYPVPAGAVSVAVLSPSTNTAELKVRTNVNSTDGGLPLNPAGPWLKWDLYPGTTSVIVNAASGGAVITLWFI
jgi:hypothetical protein